MHMRNAANRKYIYKKFEIEKQTKVGRTVREEQSSQYNVLGVRHLYPS